MALKVQKNKTTENIYFVIFKESLMPIFDSD